MRFYIFHQFFDQVVEDNNYLVWKAMIGKKVGGKTFDKELFDYIIAREYVSLTVDEEDAQVIEPFLGTDVAFYEPKREALQHIRYRGYDLHQMMDAMVEMHIPYTGKLRASYDEYRFEFDFKDGMMV